MPATETARKFDRMQDAFEAFAHDNGDGFSDRDWIGARCYCAEGESLAEEAFRLPAEDRDDFIDAQTYAFPASAQYLVAVSADYRLAELVARDAYPFVAPAYEAAA